MTRRLILALAGAGVLLVPFVASPYATTIAARILALGLLAVAVHYLSARTLQASLGHGAYFGAGAYTAALLAQDTHLPASVQLAAGATVGAAAAGLAAIALARLRGLTYVLASLAVGLIAATAAATAHSITGGTDGLTAPAPMLWFGAPPLTAVGYRYLWIAAVTLIVLTALAWHARSGFAAALTGVGDTEQRMSALGYPVTRILWRAHLHAGTVAGIAGALWVHATGYISPTDLGLATSAIALAAATIGHRHGPAVVVAATGALLVARDVAASYLPPSGQGPLWLGLLLLATAFLPLLRRTRGAVSSA